MTRSLLWLLILIPRLGLCQYCENFNTLSKTQLDSIGWDGNPNNGWSVISSGAYQGKSAFLSAGIGSTLNYVSPCFSSNSSTETISFVYTFKNGNGVFKVGIQDGFAATGTGIIWLYTLPIVHVWTAYSLNFTLPFQTYRMVAYLGNATASSKIGIDNFCLANATFIGICTALPIELTGFSAQVLDNSSIKSESHIKITWQTASEQNSKSFVLLRSSNNLNFDSIGVVNASGNSAVQVSYSFEDALSGSGQVYYRLKSVDINGQYSLSNVVSVSLPDNKESSWFVSDRIFHYFGTDNAELVIYSEQGQIVYTKMLLSNINEDLNFLNPGIYFVKLTNNSSTAMRSFVIF